MYADLRLHRLWAFQESIRGLYTKLLYWIVEKAARIGIVTKRVENFLVF